MPVDCFLSADPSSFGAGSRLGLPMSLRGTQGDPKEGGLNIGQHEGLNM